jgi:hypothetical protein
MLIIIEVIGMNKFIGRALVYLAHGPWFKHPGEKKKKRRK